MSWVTMNFDRFTTDNGAYYYYNTEPGLNYEETILKLHAYTTVNKIPYQYIQLDSWWYYRGENGGVTEWSPREEIFPNGLDYLYNQTGLFD